MKEQEILNELRELYKQGDKLKLKNLYYKNIFFLSLENRNKIQKTIENMQDVTPIMKEAQDIFGGKLT